MIFCLHFIFKQLKNHLA